MRSFEVLSYGPFTGWKAKFVITKWRVLKLNCGKFFIRNTIIQVSWCYYQVTLMFLSLVLGEASTVRVLVSCVTNTLWCYYHITFIVSISEHMQYKLTLFMLQICLHIFPCILQNGRNLWNIGLLSTGDLCI